MSVVTNFDTWVSFLKERVNEAKKAGMSEDMISKLAFEIGNFLDQRVDPQNNTNLILKQLWDVGTEDERRTIARLMVKYVENK